jgi:undecaprenyl-diphosphatase
LAAVCGVLLVVLGVLVARDTLLPLDTRVILAVRSLASPGLTRVMIGASFVAGRLAIPCALLFAAALYVRGQRGDALVYVMACVTGELLMVVIKELVQHHRPVGISPKLTDAGWYSFPSGHAMLAVIIFGLGAFLLTRFSPLSVRAGALVVAAFFVVLVGVSRVYLGAHWPSDVLGALLAGLAWSAIARSYSLAYTSRPRRIART